jgi:hypothetical protein
MEYLRGSNQEMTVDIYALIDSRISQQRPRRIEWISLLGDAMR